MQALRRVAGCLMVAAPLLLTGCGGDNAPPATAPLDSPTTVVASGVQPSTVTQSIEVTFRAGSVVGGVRRARVRLNHPVALAVTSDVAGALHVHGYNLERQLTAGGTSTLEFDATIPGLFEVELHDAKKRLIELEVR